MTRRPGALPGRISGDPATQATRLRRQRQQDATATGSRLGAGLEEDGRGRLGIHKLPRLDPTAPDFNEQLVNHLIDRGLMER
jgi:hypothetical protein